jgi:hypothetical protein
LWPEKQHGTPGLTESELKEEIPIQISTVWCLTMDWHRKLQWLSAPPFILLFCFGVAVSGLCVAQEGMPDGRYRLPVVKGYITAVHLPGGFYVNDCHVALSAQTGVGYIGDQVLESDTPIREELRPGAYIEVIGDYDWRTKTARADMVFIFNERKRVRAGEGLILKVVSTGPEPVYRADGYLIRIGSASSVSFHSGLKRLSDVGPNTVLHYVGKVGADGILEATRARFTRVEHGPQGAPHTPSSGAPGSAAPSKEGAPRDDSAPACSDKLAQTWRVVPPDQPLQERVARVGMSLAPAYQREMAGDDPAGIHFRFCAIDDEKMRSGYTLFDKHTILIPRQAVERLQNDSQLAAVLAEGMAQILQVRGISKGEIADAGVGAVLTGTMIFVAPVSAAGFATELIPERYREGAMETPVEDQRERIALGLIADAGYDPHQAPEAWRLLAPEHPAPNPQSLPYPLRSEHQLTVLATLYDRRPAPAAPGHP